MNSDQRIKKIPYKFPLFNPCYKAQPFAQSNSTTYLLLPSQQPNFYTHTQQQTNQLICTTFQNQKSACCYIVLEGECLNEYIERREAKRSYPLLTEDQIWLLVVCMAEAFCYLARNRCGAKLTHFREYSIRRIQNKNIYKLIYHESMVSQLDAAHQWKWDKFYLSPQQLNGQFVPQKSIVFSFGALLLNLISNQDRHISLYNPTEFKVNTQNIDIKIHLAKTKYGFSKLLCNFIRQCLTIEHQHRFNFQELRKCIKRKHQRIYMQQSEFLSQLTLLEANRSGGIKYDIVFPGDYETQGGLNFTQGNKGQKNNYTNIDAYKSNDVHMKNDDNKSEEFIEQQIHKLQKSSVEYKGTDGKSTQQKQKQMKIKKKAGGKFEGSKVSTNKHQQKQQKKFSDSNNTNNNPHISQQKYNNKENPNSNPNQTHSNNSQHSKYSLKAENNGKDRQKDKSLEANNINGHVTHNDDNKNHINLDFQYRGTFGARMESAPPQQMSTTAKRRQAKKYIQQDQDQEQDNAEDDENKIFKKNKMEAQKNFNHSQDLKQALQIKINKQNQGQQVARNLFQQYKYQYKQKYRYQQKQGQNKIQIQIQSTKYRQVKSRELKIEIPVNQFSYSDKTPQEMHHNEEVQTPKGFGKQGKKQLSNQNTTKQTSPSNYQSVCFSQPQAASPQPPQLSQIPEPIAQLELLSLQQCQKPLQQIVRKIDRIGVWVQGDLYYGDFVNGRRNGLSLEVFSNGEYYYGYFKEDLFSGEGFYWWNQREWFFGIFQLGQKVWGRLQGQLQYQGTFKNNKRHGKGVCWYSNQQIYNGQWYNGKRHGKGILYQYDGQRFVGQWHKGKKKGQGYIQTQSMKISGIWNDQQIQSQVLIEYSNGDIFKGKINQNLQKQTGQYICKSGSRFKGQFEDDSPKKGQFTYSNGDRYVGQLRNMKRHGYGEYYYNNTGEVYKGYWENNAKKN